MIASLLWSTCWLQSVDAPKAKKVDEKMDVGSFLGLGVLAVEGISTAIHG
jgi:hypothetical protein